MKQKQSDENTKEVTFSVPKMDCSSCATKVNSGLEQLNGIIHIDLQPTTGTATVTYNTNVLSKNDAINAIENTGYSVTDSSINSSSTTVAPKSDTWASTRAIKTGIGGVLLVFGLVFEFLLTGQNVSITQIYNAEILLSDVLLIGAISVSGLPVLHDGYYSAQNKSFDIDLLMGSAIIAATAIGYFEEAATLAVLFSVAELLEDYAMDKALNSLRELVELSPNEAVVRRDGNEQTIPVQEVGVGDIVIVHPGTKIPMDGTVIDGESAVDESPITGESVPSDKASGDTVYAGTINTDGYLEVEVTSEVADNTLSKIIERVQGAQKKKTEREQFVDRFSGYYTPAVVIAAVLTAVIPPVVFQASWQPWFIRGLTFLVIACPCAFVISTPISVVSGVTSAAKNGVLIKGGNHLESMGEINALAIDKTGTLTKGELTVTDVVAAEQYSEGDVVEYAVSLEKRSEHPIAQSIEEYAERIRIDSKKVDRFESITGKGVKGRIDGETYYAGKPDLFSELGSNILADTIGIQPTEIEKLQSEGKTVVLIGSETEIVGAVAIADEIRPEAAQAVSQLNELDINHIVMLTGDNEDTARAIADKAGISDYQAELLPEEKVEAVEEYLGEHGSVAMIGDGVNDAPALATATVGIAMGAAGTDTAIETADIALMGDDLLKLPYLHSLSKKSNSVIRQNIWASLGVKALLAIGVPLGYVSVALAVVVGDMGMSLGVTGNAMRLSRINSEPFDENDHRTE